MGTKSEIEHCDALLFYANNQRRLTYSGPSAYAQAHRPLIPFAWQFRRASPLVVPNFRWWLLTPPRGILLNQIGFLDSYRRRRPTPNCGMNVNGPSAVVMLAAPPVDSFWCLPYARPVGHSSVHLRSHLGEVSPIPHPIPPFNPTDTNRLIWLIERGWSLAALHADLARITRHSSTSRPAYAWHLGTPDNTIWSPGRTTLIKLINSYWSSDSGKVWISARRKLLMSG